MEMRKHIRQLVFAAALGAVAALVAGSPAYGKGCPGSVKNGGPSSVQQYVEQLPTSCGSHASGSGNRQTKLPASLEQEIQTKGGKDAALLEKIATSEAYGAPQHRIKTSNRRRRILTDSADHTNPLAASVGVVTDGSDARLIVLVILMLGTAAILLATAVLRRRVTR